MIYNGLFKWKAIIFAFLLLVIPASFTILGNHMTKSKQKQVKLDETEKLWYLVLLNLWSLFPEVQFYVSANSEIFLFPNFLKSCVSAVFRVHRADNELICYVLQKFSKALLIMVQNFIIPCKDWQLHFLIFIWSFSRYFADDFISRFNCRSLNHFDNKMIFFWIYGIPTISWCFFVFHVFEIQKC